MMLTDVLGGLEPQNGGDVDAGFDEDHLDSSAELDAETLLAAELGDTALLTRAAEEALAQRIARTRSRVRAMLRRARPLTRAALADCGRGVVAPEKNFREREAVLILTYARRAARTGDVPSGTRLTRRQLRAFASDLSAALADYRALRDQMVRANVRLVSALARRYRHPSLSFLDLFQEGVIGLFRAIEKYDPGRGIKFSTYATWWIWQQLARAADTQGSLIRTPIHWNQLRRRMSRDEGTRAGTNGGTLSRAELAVREGIDPDRFEAMAQSFQFVSTDAPVGDQDDRALETTLPGDESEPGEQLLQSALRERLVVALDHLPARERLILRQRFGFQTDHSHTLGEIGARLGISRERVRQLESRALKRLKEVCTSEGLREYLH